MSAKTPGEPQEIPPYEICSWENGENDFTIGLQVNACWFSIHLSPDCFSESPAALGQFRKILAKLIAGEDYEMEVWDYGDHVASVFLDDFKRLAPSVAHSGKLTLDHIRIRGSYECEYRVIQEKPVAVAVRRGAPELDAYDVLDIRKAQSTFPVFSLHEVEIKYVDDGRPIYTIIPHDVIVNNQRLFYKSAWAPYDTIDEIEKHAKIKKSNVPMENLSHLFGIVANINNCVKGLLYGWIETGDHRRLTRMITSETPLSTRQKWADQIKITVDKLHELGLVWGDVKSDNVLIDEHANAVVIGLEGGTTTGWVDRELEGTLQGDVQGTEKMMDFIFNDDSPLRRTPFSDTEHSENGDEDVSCRE